MDLALYIEHSTVAVARFDLMGHDTPTIEHFKSNGSSFGLTLQRLVAPADRVWVGPTMEQALALYAFNGLQHPQLRDAQTLFSFVPHLPHRYSGGLPSENVLVMVQRLRSCISGLLVAGL